MNRERAVVVLPGAGRPVALGSALELVFKAGDAESDGGYAIALATAGPEHPGTTPHVHREHDDISYVTAGTLAYEIADETFDAPAGTLVIVPAGLVHRWWNPHPEPAEFLNIHVPGRGFERFARELAELSAGGRATAAAMAELGARYDEHFDESALHDRYAD